MARHAPREPAAWSNISVKCCFFSWRAACLNCLVSARASAVSPCALARSLLWSSSRERGLGQCFRASVGLCPKLCAAACWKHSVQVFQVRGPLCQRRFKRFLVSIVPVCHSGFFFSGGGDRARNAGESLIFQWRMHGQSLSPRALRPAGPQMHSWNLFCSEKNPPGRIGLQSMAGWRPSLRALWVAVRFGGSCFSVLRAIKRFVVRKSRSNCRFSAADPC